MRSEPFSRVVGTMIVVDLEIIVALRRDEDLPTDALDDQGDAQLAPTGSDGLVAESTEQIP